MMATTNLVGKLRWSSCIKPLVEKTSLEQNELLELSKSISSSAEEIYNHREEYDKFYSTFVLLAAHHITNSAGTVPPTHRNAVFGACKVLLTYLLNTIQNSQDDIISNKFSVLVIKGLCTGKSCLAKVDILSYNAVLKQAPAPAYLKDEDADILEASPKEVSRPRLDTGCDIFDQLTSVFDDLSLSSPSPKPETLLDHVMSDDEMTIAGAVEEIDEQRELFGKKNLNFLLQSDGANILLDLCSNLTFLGRYMKRYKDAVAGNGFVLPNTLSEALTTRNSYQCLMNDVSIVWRTFSLSILEPLSPKRLEKILNVTLSCIYASVSVAMANTVVAMTSTTPSKPATSKDEEIENQGTCIVQRSLEIFNILLDTLHKSTRTCGNMTQNLNLITAWLILTAQQSILSLTPAVVLERKESRLKGQTTEGSKVKEGQASSRPSSGRSSFQGFGVLSVALSNKAMILVETLLKDLQVEGCTGELIESSGPTTPAGFDLNIMTQHTAWKRVKKLMSTVNMTDLFFTLITTSFRKASLLQRQKQGSESTESSSSSASDSNTFYEDDFSSSLETDEDDETDSDMLGGLFDENKSKTEQRRNSSPPPIPPRHGVVSSCEGKRARKISGEDSGKFVPEKKEPESFVTLAADILNFLTQYFLNNSDLELRKMFRTTLNEEHLNNLAGLIKELDRESLKYESNEKVFQGLSVALAKFNHSLIASGSLSDPLQEHLLAQLGISTKESSQPWPLTIHRRTLALLAEILLRSQQRERETKMLKSESEAAIVIIWERFLDTLKISITNPPCSTDTADDVNVEHFQLLLFLFHSLPLMQKKSILLKIAEIIIDVNNTQEKLEKTVPLALSRLMLVFEYLLHFFYDPPTELVDQVKWNLFVSHAQLKSCQPKQISLEDGSTSVLDSAFTFQEVEDNFRKCLADHDSTDVLESCLLQKPRFYNLGPIEVNSQEPPKVDGLACSFLLSSSDLNYNALYDACIQLLMAGSQCDKTKPRLTILEGAVIHYHFQLVWRLLACLPPSVHFLERLEAGTLQMSNGLILHALKWIPRLKHTVFEGWIKDYLVKQGMTSRNSDNLLTEADKVANNVQFDIRLVMNFLQDQIAVLPLVEPRDIVALSDLPGMTTVMILDAVIAKVQVSLDKAMPDKEPKKSVDLAQDLIPATLLLVEAYSVFIRSCILRQIKPADGTDSIWTTFQLKAFGTVMCVGSTNLPPTLQLTSDIMSTLPRPVAVAIEKWGSDTKNGFPPSKAWKTDFSTDILPGESFIEAILTAHVGCLSAEPSFSVNSSLKHVLGSLVKFASDLFIWSPDPGNKEIVRVLLPVMMDASTSYLFNVVSRTLSSSIGSIDEEVFQEKMFHYVLTVCYDLLTNYSSVESGFDEKVFLVCLKFMESHLEKPGEKKAFLRMFRETADLTSLVLVAAKEHLSSQFSSAILKLLIKIFTLGKKDKEFESLCSCLNQLSEIDNSVLCCWLSKMIKPPQGQEGTDDNSLKENHDLLRILTAHLVEEKGPISSSLSQTILSALIPLGEVLLMGTATDMGGFPELMVIMHVLAGGGNGAGHSMLFKAATGWLEQCAECLKKKEILEKLTENEDKNKTTLGTLCCLLSYIGEVLGALKRKPDQNGAASPTLYDNEAPNQQDGESDWTDEVVQDDEDSGGEDSDEESLNNKLCTFTVTQKEFTNQHWYHCHTCKMVDGVGVCTVCAKVCHKDHDLTYAKYGSFFCDCGAKEDGSCKALVKRSPQSGIDTGDHMSGHSPFVMDTILPSSLRRRVSSPGPSSKQADKLNEQRNKARDALAAQVKNCKELLLSHMNQSDTVKTILNMLETILPSLTENYQKISPMGSSQRAQKALDDLHNKPKTIENTEQLMTVTLGSQEGAFENVRMNYSGDQGQQIRQLITTHIIRRVAMCVLASPMGKRQHLAVSHEKGKITILQLSALLKQADSSKKKLTLTRLASAPIPFTVLSITGNPCNEDFLAVCGLKDCHVLTFSSSGAVADHLVLHPTLATGNFIFKAVWLPGSQTELAIVTADFVKIYNLGEETLSPQYFFLLPSHKIRDATFIFTEKERQIVIMSNSGYIYLQTMDESSSAKHGPFYITTVLDLQHNDLKESNGQIGGGGVSVYYSHSLQLLFFSFIQGKSFAASNIADTPTLFPITLKGNGGGKGGTNGQPLTQWSEIPGHTGLMYCMTQTNNNPVVLMVKPDTIMVQEVKVMPAKAKIQDVVAIRHSASNTDQQQQRTTMILLCEDGSLRIYMANVENTNFWLSPYLQPQSPIAVLKPVKKKKRSRPGRPAGAVTFPIDFFEHCQPSNDIEFGGNDLLQIYNVQQLKHRLNTGGMYVASTKPSGFTIEIQNTNTSNVMVGCRVFVGGQSIERTPSYLEVFERSTQVVNMSKPRWFDLPFTKEESMTADKKFSLFVGASTDPAGVTMVDAIKVFVKPKDIFGWPEESDEFSETQAPTAPKPPTNNNIPTITTESELVASTPLPLTLADRLLGSALEVLDGAFATVVEEKDPHHETTLNIATSLLTLPTPESVQQHTKSLLASLNKLTYYNHKDQAQLAHVMATLSKDEKTMDVEAFQRLLVTARSVAVSRPHNLIKFAELNTNIKSDGDLVVTDLEQEDSLTQSVSNVKLDVKEKKYFIAQLMEAFWNLHATKPSNPMLAPVCLPGLSYVEETVSALVEIIHAFTVCDFAFTELATKLYFKMLLSEDETVSFACKQTMIRCLRPRHRKRRVFIPSPPRCSSPGLGDDDDDDEDDDKGNKPGPDVGAVVEQQQEPSVEQIEQEPEDQFEVVENSAPVVMEPQGEENQGGMLPLQALFGGGGVNFPPMVDIPPDADDETMVELAIALSLQDQPGGGGSIANLANLRHLQNLQALGLGGGAQNNLVLDEGPLSDATASAPESDDEVGSNAATDGSTLRTSPAEHAGSGGSESGNSATESMPASGRSSAYGERDREGNMFGGRSETSSLGMPSGSLPQDVEVSEMADADYETSIRLHSLRLNLLERLLQYFSDICAIGGLRVIPYMQVILMLSSDLDNEEEKDKAALDTLLTTLIKHLDPSGKDIDNIACRTKAYEVKLLLIRLFSVLLSRTKINSKASEGSSPMSFISNCTATALITSDGINFCLKILKNLLPFWKRYSVMEDEGSSVTGQLLKSHPSHPPPDMSPFFLRQYVKGHANDVFEDYPQLLTEIVLRLPYQLKKISDSSQSVPNATFDYSWNTTLAEYMMTQQTPFVKRQVRKLLLFICGTKEKYRQLRDVYAIESHLEMVTKVCQDGGLDMNVDFPEPIMLNYDILLNIVEHLKFCAEIAHERPVNWQMYCRDHQGVLSFLVKASISLDEGVAPTLLQLLQSALCGRKTQSQGQGSSSTSAAANSPAKQKKDKDKDKDKNEDSDDGQKHDEALCINLTQILVQVLDRELLTKFIRTFLLESNASSIRWQAHSLVYNIYKNSNLTEQENLLELTWSLWKELPLYGRKAAQFVDLLGYFVLKTPQTSEKKTKEYLEKAIEVLKQENNILSNHPNAQIYNMLQGLVDFDGYYLESDPCLVCNNPEVDYTNLKLSAIKVDSKFTTTTQIVKLVGSHTISRISLRITDLKRTKMVRVLNIYYNNRTVQAVVELKNKPGIWHKARKVTLTAGQTDVKVDFPIPIVACNIMIEYSDFYDNLQATAETLQCPRCSASVPANPGVCGNCGENVFQCHKCRAINYDEKDPFLCNACGFCKYAKFDFTLMARTCCAVDPIENEEDRKKAITTINSLLEKADRMYKQLQHHRPVLEQLMVQVMEHSSEKLVSTGTGAAVAGGTIPNTIVNKSIQQLAVKYCNDCKSSFDELSKIIQKVMACRKELVEYDIQQREAVAAANKASPLSSPRDSVTADGAKVVGIKGTKFKKLKESCRATNCYGCASAAVQHCVTLLRALVTNTNLRQILCSQGMIKELIDYNLRLGSTQVRTEVKSLLCLLTKDNRRGTEEMNNLVMNRITAALKGYSSNLDLGSSVRHEMMLLAASLKQEDSCWEQRVRCVMRLFLMGTKLKHPVIKEKFTMPCLRMLQSLIQPEALGAQGGLFTGLVKPKEKNSSEEVASSLRMPAELHVNCKAWLAGDPKHSFMQWKKKIPHKVPRKETESGDDKSQKDKEEKKNVRAQYLMEKYGYRWRHKMWKTPAIPLKFTQSGWLKQAMFSPSSRSARMTACSIAESIAQTPSRKKEVIDMLAECLDDIGSYGENAQSYFTVFRHLIEQPHWKYYLAIKGVLLHIGALITKEVEHLQRLEETTLSSDLAQGFALKSLTELLALFVEQDAIKRHYKNRLVGYVLNGYLSLRKLVVQRTKLIDDSQDRLLELLEELTTGTESETKEFMQVCVETVKKYPDDDYRSPVFIFERLCSIIFPEESDTGDFLMILEKDPQQEDFLQGRMLGNPYSSSEPGLGPLMRDVKNKICQDCELVALLEDDTGMELLVNKKIISLDLPVREVHKKVWATEHVEGEPMTIIYRMRGLLGDATEDMVNSLESKSEEDIDKEEVYKMAKVLSEGDGLKVMLHCMSTIKDLVLGKQLMMVLLKLFSFAVNVKANRQALIQPKMNTITIMLGALNMALWAEAESGSSSTKGQTITEQILQVMEVILLEASAQPTETYREFSKLCGDNDQLILLLGRINSPFVRSNPSVLQGLMRLIPFLAFGEEHKMLTLINHFKPYLDFARFDVEHSQDELVHLDCFCVICSGIESNEHGNKLKDMIIEHGVCQMAVDYILKNSPVVKTLLATDADIWKDFLAKPSLSYVLRLLTGLANGHHPSQSLIGAECIPILHKLEQASSDQHIGTMAENLLEALSKNEEVAAKIEDFRQQTKAEKKRLAMAKRQKQLGALGMMTNEKGQVTVKSSVLKQMEDLKEETGLTCCICREGYRYQPQKVLAIYTFSKRVNLDDYEYKLRKTQGYSTVSHFNVIHVDCHTAAVRHARGREEWESAALQNANTKCNGLLPLWGPQVQESVFATCLARHNSYIQECTGVREPSYVFNIHDVKLLLLKFAHEKSFSEDSGGGGRQSNFHLIPYMMHMALYVINTTRSFSREEKNLTNFLEHPKDKWVESSYETDGALYWLAMALHIMTADKWKLHKLKFLDRILTLAYTRAASPSFTKTLTYGGERNYSDYKPYLVFYGIVNAIFNKVLKKVPLPQDDTLWSSVLADYIRNQDKALLECFDKVLSAYEEEMLPCESLSEFFDVIELLEEVPDPDGYVTGLLQSLS